MQALTEASPPHTTVTTAITTPFPLTNSPPKLCSMAQQGSSSLIRVTNWELAWLGSPPHLHGHVTLSEPASPATEMMAVVLTQFTQPTDFPTVLCIPETGLISLEGSDPFAEISNLVKEI
ncbi:hypothetical protein SKAU_G00029250 [Synaphobranchus kaupii]|uniref:Uncharacterized protein n=1 Tax=Synaphobranchus kaupii TaxID=118154 RepID=A0A9Q1GDY3_SYNKA|nr:hypothetical protein SKAU_G00029250 [Synaphobranchus kaupii]